MPTTIVNWNNLMIPSSTSQASTASTEQGEINLIYQQYIDHLHTQHNLLVAKFKQLEQTNTILYSYFNIHPALLEQNNRWWMWQATQILQNQANNAGVLLPPPSMDPMLLSEASRLHIDHLIEGYNVLTTQYNQAIAVYLRLQQNKPHPALLYINFILRQSHCEQRMFELTQEALALNLPPPQVGGLALMHGWQMAGFMNNNANVDNRAGFVNNNANVNNTEYTQTTSSYSF